MKTNLYKLVALIALWSTFSCDDFVEVELPHSQLPSEKVFEDAQTVHAALIDIYANMRKGGMLTGKPAGLSNLLGNYADELDFYGTPTLSTFFFYTNSLVAGNTEVAALWTQGYNQVYAANAILEGLENAPLLNEDQKAGFQGEAYFIRALLHFYLSGIYGAVPYVTTTDYMENRQVSRLDVQQVYEHLEQDLLHAVEMLPVAYQTADRIRPNRFAAAALLARVYLYQGKWDEALSKASEVISHESYLMEELPQVFLKSSRETLWQFAPQAAGMNTDEAVTFIFSQGPPPFVALSESLMASFESGDQRKILWTGLVTGDSQNWYYPAKYRQNQTGASLEYSIVLRLAEQYLIRAEAKVALGDIPGALEDVNSIRQRAGLEPLVGLSAGAAVEAILQERRSELFTEFGHRFFDLKRKGLLDQVLPLTKPGWNTEDKLFPIPQNEIGLNGNLAPQNNGY